MKGGKHWELDWVSDGLAATDAFEPPVKRIITWSRTYTRDEWEQLLGTHSDHRMLPDGQRRRLHSAVGDVITFEKPGHPQLAHLSSAEGIVVAERIAGQEFRPINYDHVPGCTYSSPEIGSIGLTEAKARERGYDVAVGKFPFAANGKARILNETSGFVKIVGEKKYDEVLGVHMIGPRSTELVAEATVALRLECTVEELIRTIHAHPTMSEAVGEAAHAAHGAAIHA